MIFCASGLSSSLHWGSMFSNSLICCVSDCSANILACVEYCVKNDSLFFFTRGNYNVSIHAKHLVVHYNGDTGYFHSFFPCKSYIYFPVYNLSLFSIL